MKHLKLFTIAILLLESALGLADDPPSTHGMLIFGARTIYASHLPMFHRPHDYQAILELSLTDEVAAHYREDREQSRSRVYTIDPEQFVLPNVVTRHASFKADLYRGHFERGGVLIAKSITVQIREVVHFRKFDPTAGHGQALQYLVFGKGAETYLAHFITAAPDFDQILSVSGTAPLRPKLISIPGHEPTAPLREHEPLGDFQVGLEYYLETGDLE